MTFMTFYLNLPIGILVMLSFQNLDFLCISVLILCRKNQFSVFFSISMIIQEYMMGEELLCCVLSVLYCVYIHRYTLHT